MTDQIHIKDLLLRTIIGVNAEERRNRQDVLINIVLFADLRPASISDLDIALFNTEVLDVEVRHIPDPRYFEVCAYRRAAG